MARRKPPARVRYERRNPTISCRVPLQFKEDLKAHLGKTGQSFGQWIREAFRGQQDQVGDIERAYWRGWQEGADRALTMISTINADTMGGSEEEVLWKAVVRRCSRVLKSEESNGPLWDAWVAATNRMAAKLREEAKRKPTKRGSP